MAQVFLHGFHIVPILEGQHGVSMAKVMDSGVECVYRGRQLFEVDEDSLGVKVSAQLIGKDDGGLPFPLAYPALPYRKNKALTVGLFAEADPGLCAKGVPAGSVL